MKTNNLIKNAFLIYYNTKWGKIMPILGIDYETCIICRNCIKACGGALFLEVEKEKIEFQDPENQCILCGHCIARCPEMLFYMKMLENL